MTLYQKRVAFIFSLMLALFVAVPVGASYAFPRATSFGLPFPYLEAKAHAKRGTPEATNQAKEIRRNFAPLPLVGDVFFYYLASAAAARIWGQSNRR